MNVRALAATGVVEAWRNGPAMALGLGLVALGVLFRTEVMAAVDVWEASTAYNHCFLVIPIVIYLLWDRREMLQACVAVPYPVALVAGLPLALAWLVAERLGIMEGRQLVAMSFAQLLFLVVLGPRLWWRVAGPLLYLYFLVPFGAFLTPWLQDITTVFVTHGLPVLGIPAYISGYMIEIPEGNFLIAEACAGLRFLIAAIAFGCLYALLMYRSPVRRAVFIAVSVLVPIVANGFRALGIVALGHYMGSAEAVAADHLLYGWIFFSVVILILIVLGLPFREDTAPRPPREAVAASSPHHGRAALVGAVGLTLLAAAGPAVAAQVDRAARSDAGSLPPFVPTGTCSNEPAPLTARLDAPGRMMVQRFDCGDGPVTLTIEVFSPRSTVSRLVGEQRRLTSNLGGEDVETHPVPVPNAPPGAWRLLEAIKSTEVVASSLWIDGRPAQLGLTARARQAWRSVFGGALRPVLVTVTSDLDLLMAGAPARRRAGARITDFLQTQPDLSPFVARLAATD